MRKYYSNKRWTKKINRIDWQANCFIRSVYTINYLFYNTNTETRRRWRISVILCFIKHILVTLASGHYFFGIWALRDYLFVLCPGIFDYFVNQLQGDALSAQVLGNEGVVDRYDMVANKGYLCCRVFGVFADVKRINAAFNIIHYFLWLIFNIK